MDIANICLAGLPILALLLLSLSLVKILKIQAAWAPFTALAITTIIVYIFALCDLLYYGAWITLALSFLFFLYTLFRCKGEIGSFFKPLLHPGMIFFIVLTGITFICNFISKKVFTGPDEIAHWGTTFKIMFYNHALYTKVGYNLSTLSYPPFAQVMWYNFTFLLNSYTEWHVNAINCMGIFAGMATIFTNVDKNKIVKLIVGMLLAYFIPRIHTDLGAYTYIHVDALMSSLTAVTLIVYFSSPKLNYSKIITVCLGLTCLVLIKDVGALFAGLIGFMVAIDLAFLGLKHKKKPDLGFGLRKRPYHWLAIVLLAVIPIVFWFSWKLHLNLVDVKQNAPTLVLSTTDTQVDVQSNVSDMDLISKYDNYIISGTTGWYPVQTTLIVLLAIFIIYTSAQYKDLNKKRMLLFCCGMTFSFVSFLVILFILYAHYFPKEQFQNFSGFFRYVSPLSVAYISLAANMGLSDEYYNTEKPQYPKMVKLAILAFLLITILPTIKLNDTPFFIQYRNTEVYSAKRKAARVDLDIYKPLLDPSKDKLFVIAQGDKANGLEPLITNAVQYEYYPFVVENAWRLFSFGTADDGMQEDVSPAQLNDYLSNSDVTYMLLSKVDSYFVNTYKSLFSDALTGYTENKIRLYKIVRTENQVQMQPVVTNETEG